MCFADRSLGRLLLQHEPGEEAGCVARVGLISYARMGIPSFRIHVRKAKHMRGKA